MLNLREKIHRGKGILILWGKFTVIRMYWFYEEKLIVKRSSFALWPVIAEKIHGNQDILVL